MSNRVNQAKKTVKRIPLCRKPAKAQHLAPKLSALAQLIAVIAKYEGVTETAHLIRLTGYSRRAICRAKAEMSVPPVAHFGGCAARGTASVPPVAQADALSPPKKKSLPHTPSKEKLTPPLAGSPTTTVTVMPASSFPENPTEADFITAGETRISLVAIDNCAMDAGLPKERARRYAQTVLLDWVARGDLPKFPMTVMRIKLDSLSRELRSRKRTDAELEHGTGRA